MLALNVETKVDPILIKPFIDLDSMASQVESKTEGMSYVPLRSPSLARNEPNIVKEDCHRNTICSKSLLDHF